MKQKSVWYIDMLIDIDPWKKKEFLIISDKYINIDQMSRSPNNNKITLNKIISTRTVFKKPKQ